MLIAVLLGWDFYSFFDFSLKLVVDAGSFFAIIRQLSFKLIDVGLTCLLFYSIAGRGGTTRIANTASSRLPRSAILGCYKVAP